ncbi:MAG: phosphatidylglycerol lysyltransferase domain-containing protein, partial [Paracoccaceae bacterium]
SDEWIHSHGKERGFSMGKFGRDYISCQRVFLAYQGGELRAFITLHEVQNEWSLDLMRHSDTIADGVMHLLVIHAIESAAAALCPRLSLAAIPCANIRETAKLATLRHYLVSSSGTKGLRRFKTSFNPNWETLYATAPTKVGLVLGLMAVLHNVTRRA